MSDPAHCSDAHLSRLDSEVRQFLSFDAVAFVINSFGFSPADAEMGGNVCHVKIDFHAVTSQLTLWAKKLVLDVLSRNARQR